MSWCPASYTTLPHSVPLGNHRSLLFSVHSDLSTRLTQVLPDSPPISRPLCPKLRLNTDSAMASWKKKTRNPNSPRKKFSISGILVSSSLLIFHRVPMPIKYDLCNLSSFSQLVQHEKMLAAAYHILSQHIRTSLAVSFLLLPITGLSPLCKG